MIKIKIIQHLIFLHKAKRNHNLTNRRPSGPTWCLSKVYLLRGTLPPPKGEVLQCNCWAPHVNSWKCIDWYRLYFLPCFWEILDMSISEIMSIFRNGLIMGLCSSTKHQPHLFHGLRLSRLHTKVLGHWSWKTNYSKEIHNIIPKIIPKKTKCMKHSVFVTPGLLENHLRIFAACSGVISSQRLLAALRKASRMALWINQRSCQLKASLVPDHVVDNEAELSQMICIINDAEL